MKKAYEGDLVDESVMRADNSEKLRDDFYAVTFMCYVFIDDHKEIQGLNAELRNKQLGESEVARNLMNCFFIWIMQLALLWISFISIRMTTDIDVDKESERLT